MSQGDLMKDEEVQAYLLQLEEFEKNMNALAAQQDFLRKSLEEHAKAQETLKNFTQIQQEAEILIPLGAGTFIPGYVKKSEHVIINVGADIFIDTTLENAIEMLDKRIKSLTEAAQKVVQQMNAIEREAGRITNLLREEEEKRHGNA